MQLSTSTDLTPKQQQVLQQVADTGRELNLRWRTVQAYSGQIASFMRWLQRGITPVLALFCVVYTHLLGILFSMSSNTGYNAQDEMSSLWENDQRRKAAGQQNIPSKSGGGAGERQEGRVAEGQASQTADQTKTILQALGCSPALADLPARRRDCFTARTRDECILGFVRKIKPLLTGCWEWTGSRQHMGHGLVRFVGEIKKTHRLVLELQLGRELLTSEFACHHCDHGWCVNPAHLYVGTAATNSQDCVSRGRSLKPRGADSWNATITQSQVDEIRAKYKPFVYTLDMLAAEYGLCRTSIKNILNRKTWKA